MNSEKISLVYLIKEAICELQTDKKLIKSNTLLQLLTKILIEDEQYNIPTNIPELYSYLKKTPINKYINSISENIYAVDEYSDLSEEFIKYLDEENSEEKGQKLMYDLLKYLRKSESGNKEHIYIEIRQFIRDNNYISVKDFELNIKSKYEEDVYQKIYKMYEKANDLNGKYDLCPICGATLNLKDTQKGECINEVCNHYIKSQNLKPIVKEFKEKMLKLNDGIYKYNLMSSIGEFKIYNKCLELYKDKNVVLYPNVDEYDISIIDSVEEIRINLDVKDTADPMRLVKLLLENTNLEKLKNKIPGTFNFIVIPEHREKIYRLANEKSYTSELINLLEANNIQIEIINERHLKNRITRLFEEM